MTLPDRPYDDDAGDFMRIRRFLVRDHADRGGRFRWTVGRFADWKFNLATPRKYVPSFLADTCHLWFDGVGDLVAFAINENVGHECFVFTRHGEEDRFGPVADWIETHWAGYARPCEDGSRELVIHLAAGDVEEGRQLRVRGWVDIGRTSTTRRYDVHALAHRPIPLPEGFRLVTMADDPNWASKLRLHHDAWHAGEPVTDPDLDLDLYAYSRTAPTYDPTLDISIVAPGGEHVASCIGFPDFENSFAEIERVCTRSDHRRQGLAAAAIQGCLGALDEAGIATASLTGYGDGAVRLYGTFDAIDAWEWHAWRRRLPRAGTGPGRRDSARPDTRDR